MNRGRLQKILKNLRDYYEEPLDPEHVTTAGREKARTARKENGDVIEELLLAILELDTRIHTLEALVP